MQIYENQHEQLWKSLKTNHEDLCQCIKINENQNNYTQVHDNNVNDAHTKKHMWQYIENKKT